jgi:hypothetical protein
MFAVRGELEFFV